MRTNIILGIVAIIAICVGLFWSIPGENSKSDKEDKLIREVLLKKLADDEYFAMTSLNRILKDRFAAERRKENMLPIMESESQINGYIRIMLDEYKQERAAGKKEGIPNSDFKVVGFFEQLIKVQNMRDSLDFYVEKAKKDIKGFSE